MQSRIPRNAITCCWLPDVTGTFGCSSPAEFLSVLAVFRFLFRCGDMVDTGLVFAILVLGYVQCLVLLSTVVELPKMAAVVVATAVAATVAAVAAVTVSSIVLVVHITFLSRRRFLHLSRLRLRRQ